MYIEDENDKLRNEIITLRTECHELFIENKNFFEDMKESRKREKLEKEFMIEMFIDGFNTSIHHIDNPYELSEDDITKIAISKYNLKIMESI